MIILTEKDGMCTEPEQGEKTLKYVSNVHSGGYYLLMVGKKGLGVSPGIAIGKAEVFRHSDITIDHETCDNPELEKEAFERAVRTVLKELDSIKTDDKAGHDIMLVHKSMVEDPEFRSLVLENIEKKKYNAAWAVEAAAEKFIALLEASGSEYFRERADDLRYVERYLLTALSGMVSAFAVADECIIVADYLMPAELFELNTAAVRGICLDSGGRTSHVAILAHSLGIPAILGLGDISSFAVDGDIIAMDGKEGDAVLSPDDDTLQAFRARRSAEIRAEKSLRRTALLPAETTDGVRIKLLCNIEGIEAIPQAISAGAEGIGLFRTEFLALHKEIFSDEEKKASIYREAALAMGDHGPVIFRTYDLGGDKIAEGMKTNEENPVLGWRAVRFCMERKDIFRSQLISILRASAVSDSVMMMFPMISGSEELKDVLSFLEEVKAECREKGIAFNENMKIGTMIEVPSAAITADIIADYVDFMSIGTNDLVQYTIAVDRGNERISHLYRPLHPAVLRLLKYVVDAGRKRGIPVSICGEIAGDADIVPLLIGMGFRELSMTAHSVLEVRKRIRGLSIASCEKLADRLLSLPDATSIENELKDFADGKT